MAKENFDLGASPTYSEKEGLQTLPWGAVNISRSFGEKVFFQTSSVKYLPPLSVLHCPKMLSACAHRHFSCPGSPLSRNTESLKNTHNKRIPLCCLPRS